MTGEAMSEAALPEARRNALLRRVDWRFLLRQQEVPRTVDLRSGGPSEALKVISAPKPRAPGSADVVVLGFPRRRALGAARGTLRPGGELVCAWRLPMPGAPARARAHLERAGFTDVRLYWPGPLPWRTPQFWLSLDSPAAAAHLLAQRPPRTSAQALLRPIWRLAKRLGVLTPICAIARAPGGDHEDDLAPTDEVAALLPGPPFWVLLTGGERSINKVVGLPFTGQGAESETIVKFARIPEADVALEREANVLRLLETDRPEVSGIPRVRADGWRVGRRELAESAIHGRPLISKLAPATFADLASRVTDWLVDLTGEHLPQPPERWWPRLVGEPLADFERDFGGVLGADRVEDARRLLQGLEALPQVCEHRDCSPWNVILTVGGNPALLDWESAEPHGLPGLDLIYFLANAVFVVDKALESGCTRQSYARMLDPTTPTGSAAASCMTVYSTRLGLSEETLRRLRLLCWIVHCRSDYRHFEMEAAGPPRPEALRGAVFLGLVEEELAHCPA